VEAKPQEAESFDVVIAWDDKDQEYKVTKGETIEKTKTKDDKVSVKGPEVDEKVKYHWELWFDPTSSPHTANSKGELHFKLKNDVPQGTYEYTLRLKKKNGEEQIIDPKIIIYPPG